MTHSVQSGAYFEGLKAGRAEKQGIIDELYEALNRVAVSGEFECFDDPAWDAVNNALAKARGETE